IMLQVDSAETGKEAEGGLYESLKGLYDGLLVPGKRVSVWEPDAGAAAVHLVFGDSMAGSLKLAIGQMEYNDTHKVVSYRDRFAIGPLWRLREEAGRTERARWFRDHIDEFWEELDHEYGAEA